MTESGENANSNMLLWHYVSDCFKKVLGDILISQILEAEDNPSRAETGHIRQSIMLYVTTQFLLNQMSVCIKRRTF